MTSVTLIPVKIAKKFGSFDLARVIERALSDSNLKLENGDIVVVSSKFAAMAEKRYVDLARVRPTQKALTLSRKYKLDPAFAQLVVNESEEILGGIQGFALTISKGILAPNAGIDRSNIPAGYAILYPKNPEKTALILRRRLLANFRSNKKLKLGVVLSDSRVTPTRAGTIGVALAVAGFRPVIDFRGIEDLFRNKLKVTIKAVADQLASAAELLMGEGSESVPVVVIRGFKANFSTKGPSMIIPRDRCLYVQGLSNAYEDEYRR
jgi:coenzyme F420-0:L-glutamate ligase